MGFIRIRPLLRFVFQVSLLIASIFNAFTASAAASEKTNIFFPKQGVICDRVGAYCIDYKGFSVAQTFAHLGRKEADYLAEQLLILSGHKVDTSNMTVTLSNRVNCDLKTRVCKKGSYGNEIDKNFTLALVPPKVPSNRISEPNNSLINNSNNINKTIEANQAEVWSTDKGLRLSFNQISPQLVSVTLNLGKQSIWYANGMQSEMYVNLDDFEALQNVELQTMDKNGVTESLAFNSATQMLGRQNTDVALNTPNTVYKIPINTRQGEVVISIQAAKVPRNFSVVK